MNSMRVRLLGFILFSLTGLLPTGALGYSITFPTVTPVVTVGDLVAWDFNITGLGDLRHRR